MVRLGWTVTEGGFVTVTIAIVVGVLGVGLALSQLMRLRTWLSQPPPEEPPGA